MGEKGEAADVERAGVNERGTVAIEAAADRGGERCVERTGDGVKEEEGRGRGSGAATAKCAGALPDGCS